LELRCKGCCGSIFIFSNFGGKGAELTADLEEPLSSRWRRKRVLS
jgi:hypothetical protein